jgi:putative ABC transport system permease protein
MLDDLRYGWRKLLQEPSFTAIAMLTLALGIGTTSAVFSLVQGVLLTPPPYRDPEQLVLIQRARADGEGRSSAAMVRGTVAGMAARLESIRGHGRICLVVQLPRLGRGQRVARGHVRQQGLLQGSGINASAGAHVQRIETNIPAGQVVILGYDVWQRKFGGDPKIIGTPIRISRRETPPTVIGVMPPGIRFLPSPTTAQEPNYNVNAQVDFWMPVAPSPERIKQPNWDVVGRLRGGTEDR